MTSDNIEVGSELPTPPIELSDQASEPPCRRASYGNDSGLTPTTGSVTPRTSTSLSSSIDESLGARATTPQPAASSTVASATFVHNRPMFNDAGGAKRRMNGCVVAAATTAANGIGWATMFVKENLKVKQDLAILHHKIDTAFSVLKNNRRMSNNADSIEKIKGILLDDVQRSLNLDPKFAIDRLSNYMLSIGYFDILMDLFNEISSVKQEQQICINDDYASGCAYRMHQSRVHLVAILAQVFNDQCVQHLTRRRFLSDFWSRLRKMGDETKIVESKIANDDFSMTNGDFSSSTTSEILIAEKLTGHNRECCHLICSYEPDLFQRTIESLSSSDVDLDGVLAKLGVLVNLLIFSAKIDLNSTMKKQLCGQLSIFLMDENPILAYKACLAMSLVWSKAENFRHDDESVGWSMWMGDFLTNHNPEMTGFAMTAHKNRFVANKTWLVQCIQSMNFDAPNVKTFVLFMLIVECHCGNKKNVLKTFHESNLFDLLSKTLENPLSKCYFDRLAQIVRSSWPKNTKLDEKPAYMWTSGQVCDWLAEVGFDEYVPKFRELKIDGDFLFKLEGSDFVRECKIVSNFDLMRFSRELTNLKMATDYSSMDPTALDMWLVNLDPQLSQYTYQMLIKGLDRNNLKMINERILIEVCSVNNIVHRKKILRCL